MRPPSDHIEFVYGISSRLLRRIQPTGRNEFRYPVRRHLDYPFFLMNLGMVEPAQQTSILVTGGAEIAPPEFDVMPVGPVRRPIASRPATTFISGDDRPPDVRRERPG